MKNNNSCASRLCDTDRCNFVRLYQEWQKLSQLSQLSQVSQVSQLTQVKQMSHSSQVIPCFKYPAQAGFSTPTGAAL